MIEPANQLVTLFGGGGFIGRYVCETLLRRGIRVRVASRNPRAAHFLQPLAQVGQIGFVRADLLKQRSIDSAVIGSSAVVNLCGVMGRGIRGVNVTGARWVAEAARNAGASALVHISAIGADPNSEAEYGRSKGEGEQAVQTAFPDATVIRPSIVFGPEDQMTNRFAGMAQLPVLPVIAADCRFQPVYVRDLAEAIARSAIEPERFGGKAYEIGGPQVMTMRELIGEILDITGQKPNVVELPDAVGSLLSRFGWVPGAPLTRDQWLMLQRDNVVGKGERGLGDFGIQPTPLEAVAIEWLGRFHPGGRFAGRRTNLTAVS